MYSLHIKSYNETRIHIQVEFVRNHNAKSLNYVWLEENPICAVDSHSFTWLLN